MAPEHPPILVIFDATLQENELVGSVKYIEAPPGESLRVRWNVESQPDDFKPVGNGVAFVYTKDTQFIEVSASPDARADYLGDFQYRWSEGLRSGIPRLMFILILPENYTTLSFHPLPVGVKNFNNRMALYWLLQGDKSNRTHVRWQIGPYNGDLKAEIVRINNLLFVEESVVEESEDIYVGELDESHERNLLKIYTRRLQKLKEKEAFQGISVDPSVLLEIEDIEEKIKRLKAPKTEDVELIRFYSQCFDRPAFQDPFEQEGSTEAFDRALEDTITAINTGTLRARDGAILAQAKGKSYLLNHKWREKMDTIVDLLRSIRYEYKLAIEMDRIRIVSEHKGRQFHIIYDRELAEWIDSTRTEIIQLFSKLCKEAGIPPLSFPRRYKRRF